MIEIRPVTEKEDVHVKEMIVTILESEFSPEEKAFFSTDIEHVSRNYAGDGEVFFIATDQNKIVGTIGIKREDERNALLRRVFVRPEYRGRKIGSQLITKAIEFCQREGYEEIVFKTTSRMKEAIKLCEANGFTKKMRIELGGLELLKFTIYLGRKNRGAKEHAGENDGKEKGR